MEMKYPPGYEDWDRSRADAREQDDEQRIKYHKEQAIKHHDQWIRFYGVMMGGFAVLFVVTTIFILAALGDLVFGWTG